jgi:hypothetical protein
MSIKEITWKDQEDQFSKRDCKLASGVVRTDYYYLFDSIKYPTLKKLLFQKRISTGVRSSSLKTKKMFKGFIRV